jgi:hypothetical protein
MRVSCTYSIVPMEKTLFSPPYSRPDYESGLNVGESYIVYGIWIEDSKLAFLIHKERSAFYPLLVPAACFADPVGNIPPLFTLSIVETQGMLRTLLSSQLFSENPDLYSQLLEAGSEDPIVAEWTKFRKAVEIYAEYSEFRE